MASLAASLIFATLFSFGLCGKLPASFPICKRNDPNLGECFSRATEKCLPLLKNGLPELQIAPIDPVTVESLSLAAGGGSFKVDQKLTNVKVYGAVNSTIKHSEITLEADKCKMVLHGFTPLLKLVCHYDFEGQMLQLPFVGSGRFESNIIDMEEVVTISCDIITKKGKKYLHVTDLTTKVSPGLVTFQFDDLFNGNKLLGDQMNKLLNENWKLVYGDVGSAYEEVLVSYLRNVADNIFNNVPFDELLPIS